MDSTLLDVKSVSTILDISLQQVRNLCRGDKIPAQKIGGAWIMYEQDINEYYDVTSCGKAKNQSAQYTSIDIESTQKPIALSFFSGAMGLDLGLEQAGFDTLLCCEIDNACRKTITKNKPDIALIGDILDYNAKDIRKLAKLPSDREIDLVVGGPPCQAFSTAGKRKGLDDIRGNVFISFLEMAIELNPKFIVIENVRGLLSAPLKHRPHNQRGAGYTPLLPEEKRGGVLKYVLDVLRNAGFGVNFNLYNSANFGTPQKRERVVILCSRDGEKLPFLTPTHSENGDFELPKWRTFRSAVSILKNVKHEHLEFPEKRLKYYRMLKHGQNWRNLPVDLQKEALGKTYYSGGGRTGFFRRIDWNKPAPTLVTHPAMPATDLAHPTENRPLSVQEYKTLQEFPYSWKIEGSLIEKYRQIGNAVPSGLGQAIGRLLIAYMTKKPIINYDGFKYSRYRNTDTINWEKEISKQH